MKTWLTLFLLSLLFTGCNSGVQSTLSEQDESKQQKVLSGNTMQTTVNFSLIKSGQYPVDTAGDKETLVFHSDDATEVEAFNSAYLTLTNEIAPSFKGTMILAKMGEKSSGGYSIELESVKDTGRFVEVTLVSKSPNGLATMALTNPYIIIALPENHKDIKIIDK
jgi:hypothetical protein